MKRFIGTLFVMAGAALSSVLVLIFLTVEWLILISSQLFIKKATYPIGISPVIDDLATDHLIITLHGTFARGASWAQSGQCLNLQISSRQQLLGINCCWHNFEWSGDNTVSARLEAIQNLHNSLKKIFSINPARHVTLVAHSHGGNIALKASEEFFENPNLRIVTMATPFLFSQRRPSTQHLMDALPVVNGVAAAGLGVSIAKIAELQYALTIPAYITSAIAVAFCVPIIVREVLGRRKLYEDQQELLMSTPDISRLILARDKILICTRAGDEADGGLKLASLASSWITRNISKIKFVPKTSELVGKGKISARRFVSILALSFSLSQKFKPRELAVLIFGSMCLEILHRAVGTRTALAAATMAVSSSETPPGLWTHYQTNLSVNRSDVLLSHSQIYLDTLVLSAITDWLHPREL